MTNQSNTSRGRLTTLTLMALAISGCTECPQPFKAGDVVRHRSVDIGRAIVVESSSIENLEGMCLVTVRDGKGQLLNLSSVELEPTP